MRTRRVYAGSWPKLRLRILERDGHACQVRLPGCTRRATCVDHIVPVEDGGAWWEEHNLRGACAHCNNARIPHRSRRWQSARTQIVLVVGPPGADLLGFVRAHADADDLVVDEDAIARAGLGQGAGHAWRAAVDALRRGQSTARRAWLTSRDPHAQATLPHHRVVVVKSASDAAWHAQRRAVSAAAARPSREW